MSSDVVMLAQELRWLQRAVERLEAQETVVPTVITDHGGLTGRDDDDHTLYLLASAAGGRTSFAANWTDLTDAGATTLHKHDHGGLDGLGDDDHSIYALLAGRSGGQSINGGTAANDDLTLQGTSNATRTSSYVLLQTNGGNVGIGTSTPGGLLHVYGSGNPNITIEASSTGAAGCYLKNSGTAWHSEAYDDSYRVVETGVAERLVIKEGGNVGIGTTNPLNKLHIYHAISAPVIKLEGTLSSGVHEPTIYMKDDRGAGYAGASIRGSRNTSYGGHSLVLSTAADNAAEVAGTLSDRVWIDRSGFVGIGTASPGQLLHVYGSGNPAIKVEASSTGAASYYMKNSSTEWHFEAYSDQYRIVETGVAERLVIKEGGNIGIGTTGPETKLHVSNGEVLLSNACYYSAENTSGTNIRIAGIAGSNDVYVGAIDNAGGKTIIREDGNDVITLHTGNVGIGTTNPQNFKLQVEGRVGIKTGVNAASAMMWINQDDTGATIPVLRLTQSDLSEEFIYFNAAAGSGNPIDTAALGTYYGKVRVSVNGTFKYMPLYN